MQGLSTILIAVGAVIVIVGYFMFLIAAFREGVLWGLLCFCFTPIQLVFLIVHWRVAKRPFLIQLLGYVVCFVAYLIAPDGGAHLHGYLHGLGG